MLIDEVVNGPTSHSKPFGDAGYVALISSECFANRINLQYRLTGHALL